MMVGERLQIAKSGVGIPSLDTVTTARGNGL